MFLPHFDVLCDLLLNRPAATWNMLVYVMKKQNVKCNVIYGSVLQQILIKKQSQCVYYSTHHITLDCPAGFKS